MDNKRKDNKSFYGVVALTIAVIMVALLVNHLQGSRNVSIRGVLSNQLQVNEQELYLEATYTSQCFNYNYGENVNVLEARYFYHQEDNLLNIYQNIENHCELIKSFTIDGTITRAKELDNRFVLSSQNHLYVIDNKQSHIFGPFNMVTDFNSVNETILAFVDYDANTRVNTFATISPDYQLETRTMDTNNAQADTILVNNDYVIISFKSDFLEWNIVNFYSRRLNDFMDNIFSNAPQLSRTKALNNQDSESSFTNINRLPYFGSKQLQCNEELSSCIYFENKVLAYNHNYSIIELNNEVVLVNNQDKSYRVLGPKNYRYDLSNDHVFVIEGTTLRSYSLS